MKPLYNRLATAVMILGFGAVVPVYMIWGSKDTGYLFGFLAFMLLYNLHLDDKWKQENIERSWTPEQRAKRDATMKHLAQRMPKEPSSKGFSSSDSILRNNELERQRGIARAREALASKRGDEV